MGLSAPQFKQEMLQLADEHLFEVALQKMFSLFDAEKIEDERVMDYFTRLQRLGGSPLNFCPDGILVAACQHPLVIHCVDLAFQLAHTPVSSCALLYVYSRATSFCTLNKALQ